MNLIIFTFALKLAFVPSHSDVLYYIDYRHDVCYTENYFYINSFIQIDIFDAFFIKGNINIPMFLKKDSFYFSPFNLGSTISAGLNYSIFEFGWTHYCIHPVIPSYFMDHAIKYEGKHDEFYIEIKGHI